MPNTHTPAEDSALDDVQVAIADGDAYALTLEGLTAKMLGAAALIEDEKEDRRQGDEATKNLERAIDQA